LNRKKFLKILFATISVFLLYLWNNLTDNLSKLSKNNNRIIIPNDFPVGITFADKVIVVKDQNKKLKIFSSNCTHLGCRINNSVNNIFICPCHGSQFSTDGEVLKGPAMKKLNELKYKIDPTNNQITIYI